MKDTEEHQTFEFSITPKSYEAENHEDVKVMIPIPLPEYTNIGDWSRKVYAAGGGKGLSYQDVENKLRQFILDKTTEVEDAESLRMLEKIYEDPDFQAKIPEIKRKSVPKIGLPEKFSFIVSKCSSQSLLTLMQMEIFMKKEMGELIRARDWEINQLSKQCEKIVAESQEAREANDMHPHKISMLNEKLRQVHTTYSLQIAQLSEVQRLKYRKAIDSLYSHGSIPADLLENIDLEENYFPREDDPNNGGIGGIQESFTIYIGAQLKSMHNICLKTVRKLTDLAQTSDSDWTTSSRLGMATQIYSRELTAATFLSPKDPLDHINSSSEFYKICEQSTELHFELLADQLKKVAEAARRANNHKADLIENSTTIPQEVEYVSQNYSIPALRMNSCLTLGDVYCTRHSNLKKMVIAFHLVTDETMQSIEINSRHPCLNGLRNIIKLTSSFGITSIHLPLLLIDRPDESTTIAWCVKRAEMVYKCVKGYLMEVCTGSSLDSLPHYNVHFVVPSGLSPTIYAAITNMFPTIFHLVPSVSISV